MDLQHDDFVPPPRIQTPCPKRWDELQGGVGKRFCSECSLHVHDGTTLTRAEATDLVAQADSRVCMRLEFDPSGQPIFKDSVIAAQAVATRRSLAERFAGWAASAAAGVLAACTRTTPPECVTPPLVPGTTHATTLMGKVANRTEKLGDVATPAPTVSHVKMGEATVVPAAPAPEPPSGEIVPDVHQPPR